MKRIKEPIRVGNKLWLIREYEVFPRGNIYVARLEYMHERVQLPRWYERPFNAAQFRGRKPTDEQFEEMLLATRGFLIQHLGGAKTHHSPSSIFFDESEIEGGPDPHLEARAKELARTDSLPDDLAKRIMRDHSRNRAA